MALHGLAMRAMPTVVTGVVGVAAYEALAKLPWRKATVIATAWGMRVVREAEHKAGASAEQARLTVADVVAEAKERAGEGAAPLTVVEDSGDHDH